MRSLFIVCLLWLPNVVLAQDRTEAFKARIQARLQLNQNNYTTAVSYYDKAIQYYPIWSTAYAERAYAKLKSGNSELVLTAIADCKQAVKYNPRNGFAKSVLDGLQTLQVTNRPLSSERRESLDKQYLLAGDDNGGELRLNPANEYSLTQKELSQTHQPSNGNSTPINVSQPQNSQQPIVITWISPNVFDLPQGLLLNKETLDLTLNINAKATKDAIEQATSIWVNDIQQPKGSKSFGEKAKDVAPNTIQYRATLTLVPGKHRIDVRVKLLGQPETRSSSLLVNVSLYGAPKLYIYSYGVNYSSDKNWDLSALKFTSQDAEAIWRVFAKQQGKLFADVIRMKLSTSILETTAGHIKNDLEEMSNEGIIRPQDVVIIFISGHGFMNDNDIRIAGSDYGNRRSINSSISFQQDVLGNLEKLTCKKIILIDACKTSSPVSGEKSIIAVADARQLVANTPPSTVIISSCNKGQKSYEDINWQNGHGAFTAALIEALEQGKAKKNKENIIKISQLFNYVTDRVPAIVKKKFEKIDNTITQNPLISPNFEDYPIYIIDTNQSPEHPTVTINQTNSDKPNPKPKLSTETQKRLAVIGLNTVGDSMDWDLTNPSTDSISKRVPKNWDVQIASGLGQTKLNTGAKGGNPFNSMVKKVSADVLCVITQQVNFRKSQYDLWVAEPTLVCQFIDVKTGSIMKLFTIPRINGTNIDKDSALQSAIKRTLSGLTSQQFSFLNK